MNIFNQADGDYTQPGRFRRMLFGGFTLIVLAASAVQIAAEFNDGESLLQMLDDLALLCLALLIAAMLLQEYLQATKAINSLQAQLALARGQLQKLDDRSDEIGRQYRDVMQKQFDAWKLTASEQEITIGLLKGLSFKEIAVLRSTHEKTVRQQATSVYRKSALKGRHELAAWFFEDLLGP